MVEVIRGDGEELLIPLKGGVLALRKSPQNVLRITVDGFALQAKFLISQDEAKALRKALGELFPEIAG